MTNIELPPPDLNKDELTRTVAFIKESEAGGTDCKALKDYIAPLLKRTNLNSLLDNHGEATESRDNK